MHVSSNEIRTAEDGNITHLVVPPSYHDTNASEFSLNNLHKTKLTKSTIKAWATASGARRDPDASTIVSAAETLTNPAKPVLSRGLQVPTRRGLTSGYPFPEILEQAGVTYEEWSAFSKEVRKHASLSKSQWAVTLAGSSSLVVIGGVFMGVFAVIPATLYGNRVRSRGESLNFALADNSGALAQCVSRWNRSYFRARGLAVRVDIPGRSQDMEHMDLSSSKLYQSQQKFGDSTISRWRDERKDQLKDGRARMRASRKGRIVIIPLDSRHQLMLHTARVPSAFPGLDGAQDDEVADDQTEAANDDVSVVCPLLPKRDRYPDEPKP